MLKAVVRNAVLGLLAVGTLAAAPPPGYAGTLDDFERDLAPLPREEEQKQKRDRSGGEGSEASEQQEIGNSVIGDIVGDVIVIFAGEVAVIIGEGGSRSMRRVDPNATRSDDLLPRREGEALLPFVRIDSAYQRVASDIGAWDWRTEAGYGALAFQVRATRYDENNPPDELKTSQYHFLLRMSPSSTVEIDAGIGGLFITGNEQHSGISLTVPFLIHPSDHFGVELRPTWSAINESSIQDIDLAVLAGWRYVSVRAGYRWFRSDRQSLDGPFAGISLRW